RRAPPPGDRPPERHGEPNRGVGLAPAAGATPWGHVPRFLIRDRDRVYGHEFPARTARMGIRTILTPVRAPRANDDDSHCTSRVRFAGIWVAAPPGELGSLHLDGWVGAGRLVEALRLVVEELAPDESVGAPDLDRAGVEAQLGRHLRQGEQVTGAQQGEAVCISRLKAISDILGLSESASVR